MCAESRNDHEIIREWVEKQHSPTTRIQPVYCPLTFGFWVKTFGCQTPRAARHPGLPDTPGLPNTKQIGTQRQCCAAMEASESWMNVLVLMVRPYILPKEPASSKKIHDQSDGVCCNQYRAHARTPAPCTRTAAPCTHLHCAHAHLHPACMSTVHTHISPMLMHIITVHTHLNIVHLIHTSALDTCSSEWGGDELCLSVMVKIARRRSGLGAGQGSGRIRERTRFYHNTR